MAKHGAASPGPASSPAIAKLEAEIGARRDRLAGTIDELVDRANPKTMMQRQAGAARARLSAATTTDRGELRLDRVALVAAVVVVLGGVVVLRRRRHRRR
jgi:hypothetical protein